MSATSSSPASSPSSHSPATKPQHNCLECKRLKRACDKGSPCGKCAKANRTCEYKDPSDDGVFGPISSAKDIHSLAFGTLLDILVNRSRVREAVSLYFNTVNLWFTIIEKAGFERQLEDNWDNLAAEASITALCMVLIARPPNQKPSKGMGDTVYHSTKAILSLVQSKVPMSVQLLQAELLVAMYEFSQSMPQQAYLSVGRCLQIIKTLGWHNPTLWSAASRAAKPRELKQYSILWWATVYVDYLLNLAYRDQDNVLPMHTAGQPLIDLIPTPDMLSQRPPGSPSLQFAGQGQFQDANSDHIDGISFPEATSFWYLSKILLQLSLPKMQVIDLKAFDGYVFDHAQLMDAMKWRAGARYSTLGIDCISMMKINEPILFAGPNTMPFPDPNHGAAVQRIRNVIQFVVGKSVKLAEAEDRVSAGIVDPCWALAMCDTAQLLITHGDNVLGDAGWFAKATSLRTVLDKIAKRWKIAEHFSESLRIALDRPRLAAWPS